MAPGFDKLMLYTMTFATLFGVCGLTYCRKHVSVT